MQNALGDSWITTHHIFPHGHAVAGVRLKHQRYGAKIGHREPIGKQGPVVNGQGLPNRHRGRPLGSETTEDN